MEVSMSIQIEHKLNKENIDSTIKTYKNSLSKMDRNIPSDNIIDFLLKLKRDKMSKGPYVGVSLFEAANRIMTDLVILYGIKDLLNGEYEDIDFPEYTVEYGHGNHNNYDIVSEHNGKKLIGEAFNVSPSLFKSKKNASLKKLRNNKGKKLIKILIYNNDAVNEKYKPKTNNNEYHIRVNIDN